MSSQSASSARGGPVPSNNIHDRKPALDEVDRRILALLAADARMPNNALAERVGIAASTCLSRVRALRHSGVIRGYHADVDPSALGRPIQAMIAVRLQSHSRGSISGFAARVAQLPEVLSVFFLAGAMDFYIHIAAISTDNLRDFVVVNLSANPDVAVTETSLIFDHVRGRDRPEGISRLIRQPGESAKRARPNDPSSLAILGR